MVYCGKASQGCQNCRTRRIKPSGHHHGPWPLVDQCDKLRPECSQCLRAHKKCRGYRDELSLMFRDESNKVMQKAHAQWGLSDGGDSDSTSTLTVTATCQASYRLQQASPVSPVRPFPESSWHEHVSDDCQQCQAMHPAPAPLLPAMGPAVDERGVQFYISRYILGHPDEPKAASDMTSATWIWHPALQDIMAATGLASIANISCNSDMMTLARQKYGNALRHIGQLIQSTDASPPVAMRGVVMLALFERVVRETHQSSSTPYAHVMGGAALLRSWLPLPRGQPGGLRALLQFCYTMFIPIHASGKSLPSVFMDWISFASQRQPLEDQPSGRLARLIARLVQISAFIRHHVLSDSSVRTGLVLQQLVRLDEELGAWEVGASSDARWRFKSVKDDKLSPLAVFEGEYHIYNDLWTARVWNHYRWARVLVNQLMLEFVNQYPAATLPILSAARQAECYGTTQRVAKDTLVSVPSHWRHPLLPPEHPIFVDVLGTAGSGAAGIAPLLFQVKVAACAPRIPLEYWEWAFGIVQCVWGDMGMMHALSMMETMRAHRNAMDASESDNFLSCK